MITFKQIGDFADTTMYLKRLWSQDFYSMLEQCGQEGVDALRSATPVDTGATANAWYYRIMKSKSGYTVTWCNDSIDNGFPVAIMLQYGHGTGTGAYVQGIDYINPALQPVFQSLAERIQNEVSPT